MTKAPERLKLEPGYNAFGDPNWKNPSRVPDTAIGGEYIHIDHALALAAEEREACAKICDAEMERLEPDKAEGYGAGLYDQSIGLASDIRARTDDAQAALERRDARIRNEAFAAAWSIADQNGDVETASALQRLITEDQSDE